MGMGVIAQTPSSFRSEEGGPRAGYKLKRRPGRGTSPGRKRHLYSSSLTSARYLLLPYKKGIAKKDTRRQARPPTNPCCPLQDTANYMDGATLTAVPASAGSRKLGTALCPMGRGCGAVQCGGGVM